jgi:hypothetical protein
VYENKLTGSFKKSIISNMFSGSGAFVTTKPNAFDTLVVDEAHRLAETAYMYMGDNQIKDLMNASKCLVFFLDEDQRVHIEDAGNVEEIKKWASRHDAEVIEMELCSQFRCNGSDGYLGWLDNIFQIRETANTTLDGIDYDFQVFSSPAELRDVIVEKNKINNKSRMVAGYCWEWNSKRKAELFDVVIPEYNFKMKWNLTTDGSLWIIKPESVNEIGCIHTCQGLEVDYIGVIVGPDLLVRNGNVLTQPAASAKSDRSVFGYKSLLQKHPEHTETTLKAVIKNTYRTLMTRGMKGCYIYCTDKETEEYFRQHLQLPYQEEQSPAA